MSLHLSDCQLDKPLTELQYFQTGPKVTSIVYWEIMSEWLTMSYSTGMTWQICEGSLSWIIVKNYWIEKTQFSFPSNSFESQHIQYFVTVLECSLTVTFCPPISLVHGRLLYIWPRWSLYALTGPLWVVIYYYSRVIVLIFWVLLPMLNHIDQQICNQTVSKLVW